VREADPVIDETEIPEEYRRLGWSGTFTIDATLGGGVPMLPAAVEEFAARLPARVPFGTNSGWLALRVNREEQPPTVLLVRRDADALCDMIHPPTALIPPGAETRA
jgi:hypothetical protein